MSNLPAMPDQYDAEFETLPVPHRNEMPVVYGVGNYGLQHLSRPITLHTDEYKRATAVAKFDAQIRFRNVAVAVVLAFVAIPVAVKVVATGTGIFLLQVTAGCIAFGCAAFALLNRTASEPRQPQYTPRPSGSYGGAQVQVEVNVKVNVNQ